MLVYFVFSFLTFYNWFFLLIGLIAMYFKRIGIGFKSGNRRYNKFAVIICAHNEEFVIGNILSDLKRQSYLSFDIDDVFVFGDNCCDLTFSICKSMEAHYIDVKFGGKQRVLNYVFGVYDFSKYDYIVVLDADNRVNSDYLSKLDTYCYGGIVQSYLDISNSRLNWVSGSYAVNYRYMGFLQLGKSVLGLNCLLGGTGSAFPVSCIKLLQFNTLVDDLENTVLLSGLGYKTVYAFDCKVYDEKPKDFHVSFIQRLRWARGTYQVIHRYGFDFGTMLSNVRSFDLLFYLLACLLATVYIPLMVYNLMVYNIFNMFWAYFIINLFVFCLVFLFDENIKLREIVWIPVSIFFSLSNMFISIYGLFTFNKRTWIRTKHIGGDANLR